MLRRFLLSTTALRAARTISSTAVRKIAQPRYRITSVRFASSNADEPEYVVDSEGLLDVSKAHVTYLTDAEKQHIYSRFILDPIKWDIQSLAQHYQMSFQRAQAIVFLMHKRCKMLREMGFQVDVVGADDAGSAPGHIKVTVPRDWEGLYELHKKEPQKDLATVIEEFNSQQDSEDNKTKLSAEEVKRVFEVLKDHERRTDNLRVYESHMEKFLAELAEDGVNVNFQEIKAVNEKAARFEQTYFPRLLRDDEIDREKASLLKRIEAQTKASVDRSLNHYVEQYAAGNTTAAAAQPHGSGSQSRWKFGFRDVGKEKEVRKLTKESKGGAQAAPVVPTLIRTRSGKLRLATPLEESQRTWNQRPSYIDQAFAAEFPHLAEKLVTPFVNVDGDDHLTSELGKEKRKQARLQAAEAGAGKDSK